MLRPLLCHLPLADRGEVSSFLAHACDPSCCRAYVDEAAATHAFYATRTLEPGDELSWCASAHAIEATQASGKQRCLASVQSTASSHTRSHPALPSCVALWVSVPGRNYFGEELLYADTATRMRVLRAWDFDCACDRCEAGRAARDAARGSRSRSGAGPEPLRTPCREAQQPSPSYCAQQRVWLGAAAYWDLFFVELE